MANPAGWPPETPHEPKTLHHKPQKAPGYFDGLCWGKPPARTGNVQLVAGISLTPVPEERALRRLWGAGQAAKMAVLPCNAAPIRCKTIFLPGLWFDIRVHQLCGGFQRGACRCRLPIKCRLPINLPKVIAPGPHRMMAAPIPPPRRAGNANRPGQGGGPVGRPLPARRRTRTILCWDLPPIATRRREAIRSRPHGSCGL